jgi:transaldolase
LMFSLKHYEDVANAYIRGLERRIKAGEALDRVASVASVFVSRVDTLVDKLLDAKLNSNPNEANAALRGTAAVANAKLIYQRFLELFRGDKFKSLAAKGAHLQRPLWASTGTKDPQYSDVKYVEELVGPDTVNTMPPATMDAFRGHGKARPSLTEGVEEARDVRARFAALGIDFIEVGETLQKEGVESFKKSFEELAAAIKKRRDTLLAS